MTILELTKLYPEGISYDLVQTSFPDMSKFDRDIMMLREIKEGEIRVYGGKIYSKEKYYQILSTK